MIPGRFSPNQSVNDSKANSSIKCFEPELPANLPPVYIARLSTFSANGAPLSENTYIKTNDGKKDFTSLNNLKQVKIKGKLTGKNLAGKLERFTFIVTNPTRVMAVSIKLNARDGITGKRILPAYFSDGYFTLLPGESRTVVAECPQEKIHGDVKISAEGFNVPLQDILKIKK